MPDYVVRLPDGREVTVRGAPNEAAARARVQQEFNLPAPQSAPTPEQQRGQNLGATYSRYVNDIVSRVPGVSGFADALPRSFNLSDELTGAAARGAVSLRNRVKGENSDVGAAGRAAAADERQQVAQYRQDNPVRAFGEELAAQGGAAMLTGGTSLGQSMGRFAASRPVAAGAVFGGVEGGVSGAGAGENLRDRTINAGQGAGVGALLGGGLAGGGRLIGDLLPSGRRSMPEIEQLQAATQQAYQEVDDLGARFSRDSVDGLFDRMRNSAVRDNINPAVHERAASVLGTLDSIVGEGDVSLTRLDQLRQVVRRDVMGGSDADQYFGRQMIDAIDDYIGSASVRDMTAGTAEDAARAVTAAREANSRFRKSELVADAIERARLRAASTGSGGNEENAIRQNLRRLIEPNSRTRNFFSDEERQAIQRAVEGDTTQNALRLVGRFAPTSGGLTAMLGFGAGMTMPQFAFPAVAAGEAAKYFGGVRQQALIDGVERMVRTGANPAPVVPTREIGVAAGLFGGTEAARRAEERERARQRMMGPR
jgi:hypothetical protein